MTSKSIKINFKSISIDQFQKNFKITWNFQASKIYWIEITSRCALHMLHVPKAITSTIINPEALIKHSPVYKSERLCTYFTKLCKKFSVRTHRQDLQKGYRLHNCHW